MSRFKNPPPMMISLLKAAMVLLLLSPTAAVGDVIDRLNVPDVALTFDACETRTPSYFDERILSYLVKEKVPFTIFVTGRFANRNRERLRELARHPFIEFENHSFNHHLHMDRLPDGDVAREVGDLADLLAGLIGNKTKYFRFPGGHYDARALRIVEAMGYKVVHWSFPSGDPDRNVTPGRLTQWVSSKSRAGSVLIFHINGRGYSTGEALPGIVESLTKKGFRFVRLDEGGL